VLLLGGTSDLLRVVTGQAVNVAVHASYVDNNTSTGAITPGRTNTAISTATTTTVTGSPAASTIRNVKTLHVRNTHASSAVDVTVNHTDGTTSVDLYKVTLAAGESLAYIEGVGFRVFDVTGLPKTVGITTGSILVAKLASDAANSSTTPAEVAGLTVAAPAGTYLFEYFVIYQTAATGTGIKFSVNHSGTVTSFVANWHVVDNTATAATAAADQDAIAATAQVYSAFAARAKSTAGWGTTISVDTANADMFAKVEGIMVVTADGNLQLYSGSAVAASNATVKAGSSLRLTRTA
jgi:hypothetical protein